MGGLSRRALVNGVTAAVLGGPVAVARGTDAPVADHHLHIQGPDISAELKRMARRLPELFKGIDPGLLAPHDASDALRTLDEAGIAQGVLLSQAYTFASPYARPDAPQVVELTRRENAFNVEQAHKHPGRLAAFVGVDPVDESAFAEVAYWAGRPGVRGVKMHFGNSDVDLADPAQLDKIGRIFDLARRAGLGLVVHARPGGVFDRPRVDRFIERVLPHAGDAAIQIAHVGGGGGPLDTATLNALDSYGRAIARRAPGTRRLVFDLAVVVVQDHTDPGLAQRLAALIRDIGPERFVFGSDWPSLYSPGRYWKVLKANVPLSSAEWSVIRGNRAGYLRAQSSTGA